MPSIPAYVPEASPRGDVVTASLHFHTNRIKQGHIISRPLGYEGFVLDDAHCSAPVDSITTSETADDMFAVLKAHLYALLRSSEIMTSMTCCSAPRAPDARMLLSTATWQDKRFASGAEGKSLSLTAPARPKASFRRTCSKMFEGYLLSVQCRHLIQ
jgi:hypothetical protein